MLSHTKHSAEGQGNKNKNSGLAPKEDIVERRDRWKDSNTYIFLDGILMLSTWRSGFLEGKVPSCT